MSEFLNTYIFHWLPSRAIWIAGHTLSWDARCAGIYIGFGIGVLYHLVTDRKAKNLPPLPILITSTFLFFPLFIDVFAISYGFREPSNDIRYLTGLLFGMAFSVYLFPPFIMLSHDRAHDHPAINSFSIFTLLLIFIAGAFFLKAWNTTLSYVILESLSFAGFASLFGTLIFNVLKTFMNSVHGVNDYRKKQGRY
ncbi:MAG: DUF2085 domain-containing protein [Nitrospirota bacterium]|nr:DUF2085 domain-containing protein [Nitrospirota bacterium]